MYRISLNAVLRVFLAIMEASKSLPINDALLLHLPYTKNNTGVCDTKECLTMDANFLEKVDLKQDPCQDFYLFSCGNYIKSNNTPVDKFYEYDKAIIEVKRHLHNIIKGPTNENDTEAMKMAKGMYHSCMKHESGVEDVKKLIEHIGGWSLLDKDWRESDFSLDKFYFRSWEMGYIPQSLLIIEVNKDIQNSKNSILIQNPQPMIRFEKTKKMYGIPKTPAQSLYDLDLVLDFYLNKLMPILAAKLKVDLIEAQEKFKEFIEIDRLVMSSIEQFTPQDLSTQLQNSWITMAELKNDFSNIPWSSVIQPLFHPTLINDSEIIMMECRECLTFTNVFIGNIPSRSLNNYLMWSLIIDTLIEVDGDLLETWLAVFSKKNKEGYCADLMINHFRRVFDYEYIERYFDKSLRSEVSNFTHILKNTMEGIMQRSTRMDSITKYHATRKLRDIAFEIAYDDKLNDEQKLQEYYTNLHINSSSYLTSLLSLSKFTKQNALKVLHKYANASSHYFEATKDILAYSPLYNTVYISVHFLGHTFYSRHRPQYLNYGRFGFFTSHELNHAFSGLSLYLNESGDLEDWTRIGSKIHYYKMMRCLVQQYSDFINIETGDKVDGHQTFDENFADNGGILVAYKAYEEYLKKCNDLSLPHFKQFTPRQMFWISMGAVWCTKRTEDTAIFRERYDVHALEHIRTNVPLMNSVDFAKDWNCKPNTPMNPIKKCAVWN